MRDGSDCYDKLIPVVMYNAELVAVHLLNDRFATAAQPMFMHHVGGMSVKHDPHISIMRQCKPAVQRYI